MTLAGGGGSRGCLPEQEKGSLQLDLGVLPVLVVVNPPFFFDIPAPANSGKGQREGGGKKGERFLLFWGNTRTPEVQALLLKRKTTIGREGNRKRSKFRISERNLDMCSLKTLKTRFQNRKKG